jgi:recombination endonuclease VII
VADTTAKERVKRWYAKQTPEAKAVLRDKQRVYVSGWTPERTQARLELQGHACDICRRPFDESCPLKRDHLHVKPPVPRGLLCNWCNSSLGHYETSQRRVGLVIQPYEEYLVRHGTISN